jgi:hypothetical protein
LVERRRVLGKGLRVRQPFKVQDGVVDGEVPLDYFVVVAPLLEFPDPELRLGEDVVFVEHGVLPVTVGIQQGEDEVGVLAAVPSPEWATGAWPT